RSLYAAFGTKEELFRCAVRRYLDGPGGFVAAALQQPRARDVATTMVHGAADSYTDPDRPRGCLLVHGALAAGGDADAVRVDLAQQRDAGIKALAHRFDEAQAAGELPAPTSLSRQRARSDLVVAPAPAPNTDRGRRSRRRRAAIPFDARSGPVWIARSSTADTNWVSSSTASPAALDRPPDEAHRGSRRCVPAPKSLGRPS